MDKGISRRDFIVGGGVFGASMAAVGLAGCAPSNGGLPSTGADASGTSTHKGADRPLSSRLVEVDEGAAQDPLEPMPPLEQLSLVLM